MSNVFSHPYKLDESNSNFRVVRWYFSLLFIFEKYFCLHTVENLIRSRVFAASDLVLHCLPTSNKKDARLIWVNKFATLFSNPKQSILNLCLP